MTVRIQTEDFNIAVEIKALCDMPQGEIPGALVTFTGIVRDLYNGKKVRAVTLEHYPGMTERELERIRDEAMGRWPLGKVTIIHRIGKLNAADNIVFVGCISAHRDAAFEAARFIMDYLKTDAPFWKAEETEEGVSWVDARDSDRDSLKKWGR
jgi:molybdopterin synthase catalytic subunit